MDGSSGVDRKGMNIFSGTLGKEHGLMCSTSTLDKGKKLGEDSLVCVCVRVKEGGFGAEFRLHVAH